MGFNKWTSRGLIASLALAAGLLGASQTMADTVRVGLQAVPTDELYKAKDWGEKYGLAAEISSFSSASDSLKAFLANRVDIANGGASRLVTMAAKQPEEFYIVGVNQYGGERYGVMLPSDSTVTSIADLKGKKIGAVTGSGTYNTFRVFLEQNGLKESDFQIVNMKVEDLRAAVVSKIIDAAVAWEPHIAIAESSGAVKRFTSLAGVNESPNFVLVRRNFADANPDTVAMYLASLIDMAEFLKSDPAAASEMAAEEIGKSGVAVPKEALAVAMSRIKLDPEVTDAMIAELQPLGQSMLDSGNIKALPDYGNIVNNSFYQRALEIRKGADG